MSQIKPKAVVLIVPFLRIITLLKGIYKTSDPLILIMMKLMRIIRKNLKNRLIYCNTNIDSVCSEFGQLNFAVKVEGILVVIETKIEDGFFFGQLWINIF